MTYCHSDSQVEAENLKLQEDRAIFVSGVKTAINRLEEISDRDGGPVWHRAKEILGADLYLVLRGLKTTLESAESV